MLVELMGKESRMPCFSSGVVYATTQLKQRFQLQLSETEAETFVDKLIHQSMGSYFTRMVSVSLPYIICLHTDPGCGNSTTSSSIFPRVSIKNAARCGERVGACILGHARIDVCIHMVCGGYLPARDNIGCLACSGSMFAV